jgi:hypothetical protein
MKVRPSTGTLIWVLTLVGFIVAGYYDNLAAAYSALGFGTVVYMLHVIEVKLNKLLDHHDIFIHPADME